MLMTYMVTVEVCDKYVLHGLNREALTFHELMLRRLTAVEHHGPALCGVVVVSTHSPEVRRGRACTRTELDGDGGHVAVRGGNARARAQEHDGHPPKVIPIC
jgi:hypothetical protein